MRSTELLRRAAAHRLLRWAAASGLAAAAFGAAPPARAAGLYLTDRGVRPLARGGAFVAGADDLGALWYNPAGLVDAGTSLFADFSVLSYGSEYTRQKVVRNADEVQGVYTYAPAKGQTPFLPIPTLAGSLAFGKDKEWVVAAGLFAPYTPLPTYSSVAASQPVGSRYALLSLDGTLMAEGGVWVAYKPVDAFRIGVGISVLGGNFNSKVAFNANPREEVLGASEDPQFDTAAKLAVGPIFTPRGSAGITVVPSKYVRIGVSGQLPLVIDSAARVTLQMPSSPLFANAYQEGDEARVRFRLPPVFRLGVEVRPVDAFRVEVAYVREFWSVHSNIQIEPQDIRLYGITGFPSPFYVQPITLTRGFQDADSFRFGGEYTVDLDEGRKLDLRVGVNFDRSAVPPEYVTALTPDGNKVTFGLGAGFHLAEHWRFDATYAHVFVDSVNVSPFLAKVARVNPVRGNETPQYGDNGGKYASRADVFGVGVSYKF